MPGIPLSSVPDSPRAAWAALRDELSAVLGDDLVAMWAFGGTTSVDDPAHAGDLDTYVLLRRRPDEPTARRLEEVEVAIAERLGVEWDNWYVLVDDARLAAFPRHAWRDDRRDTAWALNRAHFLAGRYVGLHGSEPPELVAAPTWPELETDLSRELEHIERHVLEGDTDSYEATYAFLNGSRILHSIQEREPALSKRAAGAWAREHLPARWRPALDAALRTYAGEATAEDIDLLAAEMAPFVAHVRDGLPYTDGRSPDEPPRWSGS